MTIGKSIELHPQHPFMGSDCGRSNVIALCSGTARALGCGVVGAEIPKLGEVWSAHLATIQLSLIAGWLA
jgi:hypothetical protein